MAERLETGSVVRLKSGGPKMTVGDDIRGSYSLVRCYWFEGCDLRENSLERECLEAVGDPVAPSASEAQ